MGPASRDTKKCLRYVANHNEKVKKNRQFLSKIIDCVKFCGKYELPLRGHDESSSSHNPGVFRGLINFISKFDLELNSQISSCTIFKGLSKTVQNDILESILHVCKQNIAKEIENASFLAVMLDETTDIFDKSQVVIVFRYEVEGKLVERFWGFFNPVNQMAATLSCLLLDELKPLIGNFSNKLIAQTYDGAAALSGINNGVQARIKKVYSNAHFVHCYAHQLNLILEKAASQNKSIRVFFNNLSGIPAFFSKSPQRMSVLEDISAGQRVPSPSSTRWSFKSRTVNAVYEMKDELIQCCTELQVSQSKETGCAAYGIKRMLEDPEFQFWLKLFSKIMPHVEIFYNELQSRDIDATKATTCLEAFKSNIQKIRNNLGNTAVHSLQGKRRAEDDKTLAAKEVCDVILFQCQERFRFTGHLEASRLFVTNNFPTYTDNFPVDTLDHAITAYPMLEKKQVKK